MASGKPRASHFGPEPSLFWAGFHRPSRKAVRWDVFLVSTRKEQSKQVLTDEHLTFSRLFLLLVLVGLLADTDDSNSAQMESPHFSWVTRFTLKALAVTRPRSTPRTGRKSEESLPQRPGDLRNGVVGGPGVCLLTPACLGQGAVKNFQMSILSSHLKFFQLFKNVESVLTPRAEPHQKAGWTGPQSVVY